MNAFEITAHEANFDKTGIDSNGKYHSLEEYTTEIPGESNEMTYVRVKPLSEDETYFYRTKPQKEQIVLHYTVGYLKGDIATLTTHDYHVSVPFVIGRKGTIYNLFFSGYWAYHLGRNAVGGNTARSKATIGIELSNIGPLKHQGNKLSTIYSNSDTYCSSQDAQLYKETDFRGHKYYATFTNEQYDSLVSLLRYLTARYDIPREFLPVPERFETEENIARFNGIVSHVNYRRYGKQDIGPAFEWDRVIQRVKA